MYGGMQKSCQYRPLPNPLEPTAIARLYASRDQRKRQQASRSSNTITRIRSIDPAKGAALNRISGTCRADGQFFDSPENTIGETRSSTRFYNNPNT
jgi:hypothetical protein